MPLPEALSVDVILQNLCSFMELSELHGTLAPVCSEWLSAVHHCMLRQVDPHLMLINWSEELIRLNQQYVEALRLQGLRAPMPTEAAGDDTAQQTLAVAHYRARADCADISAQVYRHQWQVVRQLAAIRHSCYTLQVVARERAKRLEAPWSQLESFDHGTARLECELQDTEARLKRVVAHCEGSAIYSKQRQEEAMQLVRRVSALYNLPSVDLDRHACDDDSSVEMAKDDGSDMDVAEA
eukprot:TRINITY_DN21583_c0_g1_i1.p1 TRINITY_DN21583_c0_g1~~TRINITY_DN21583_c0_g1_i1.p1  ORF type:complete len:239 (+),score=73.25 TRINITY_DN21583_c0_g1_i1:105-821(+)